MLPNFLKPYHTALSNLIRLGRKSDGGYVIDKRVISKTKAIITCGLEAEWSFEKQFQEYNKNCKILAFDHTVNNKFWADRFLKDFISLLLLRKIKPYQILDVFKFVQYLTFFKGKNKHYLKKIVSKKTKQNNQITISEAIGDNKDIILKDPGSINLIPAHLFSVISDVTFDICCNYVSLGEMSIEHFNEYIF